MNKPPKQTTSGKHEAVQAFRQKLDSIQDGTLEELLALNRKLDEEIECCPGKKDPRRDGDSDPPVDKVEFPTVPAPPEKKP